MKRIGKTVAPLAGAWIEILKRNTIATYEIVAPLAGAWIEILKRNTIATYEIVAPLAGAWIEIYDEIMEMK